VSRRHFGFSYVCTFEVINHWINRYYSSYFGIITIHQYILKIKRTPIVSNTSLMGVFQLDTENTLKKCHVVDPENNRLLIFAKINNIGIQYLKSSLFFFEMKLFYREYKKKIFARHSRPVTTLFLEIRCACALSHFSCGQYRASRPTRLSAPISPRLASVYPHAPWSCLRTHVHAPDQIMYTKVQRPVLFMLTTYVCSFLFLA